MQIPQGYVPDVPISPLAAPIIVGVGFLIALTIHLVRKHLEKKKKGAAIPKDSEAEREEVLR
jgi:hypothetical protein